MKSTLFEPFQLKGYFWLPRKEELKLPGNLVYGDNEITLDLFEGFEELPVPERFNRQRPEEEPTILGILENGKECTLYNTLNTKSRYQSIIGGLASSKWTAQAAFVGKHFSTPEEIKFTSIGISFTHLEEWIGKIPFQPITQPAENQSCVTGTTFEFPDPFDVKIPSLQASIRSEHSAVTTGGMYRFQNIEHLAGIVVTPEGERQYAWFFQVMRALQNLLILLIGTRVYLRSFSATGNEITLPGGRKEKETIDVFLRFDWKKNEEFMNAGKIQFSYPTIREKWPAILQGWFEKNQKLKNVFNLFFSTYYKEDIYLEHEFLTLIQAIETYSRSTSVSKYLSDDDFKKMEATLNAAIPAGTHSDFRNQLKTRNKFANEYSLRKRLGELLTSLEKETCEMFCAEVKDFTTRIVDTRNYLTHYSDDTKQDALPVSDLYYANMRLQLFLIVLIAKEIGLCEGEIRKALTDHSEWGAYISAHLSKAL
jgi:hypothetical protein